MIGSTVIAALDNFEGRWTPHSQADVDLCAMPIAPLLRDAESQGKAAFYAQVDHDEAHAYGASKVVMAANAGDAHAQEGFAAFLDKRDPKWEPR